MTKFYTTGQNNSGGSFDHDAEKGIGYKICVEANSAKEAEQRLQTILDSYDAGYDCPCCGPRWDYWIDESDGADHPTSYGPNSEPLKGGWGIPSYVHMLDGTIVELSD